MPFTPTNDLGPNPAVRIFFSGLLILEPLADNTCQVFVHNSSIDHNLSIEVRRKRQGKPDIIIMRILGPLSFTGGDPSRTHGLLIRSIGIPTGPKGIKGYDSQGSSEGTKLRDSFDLSKIHDVLPGQVDVVGGLPSILLDDATFYTAELTPMKATLKKKDGKKEVNLTEVPQVIGANVYLDPRDPNQQLQLTWRQSGRDVNLNLEQSKDFTYEVYINNEPLFEDDSVAAPFKHDEFEEYYKILPAITPKGEQFELVFPEPPPHRGSTRTPCMSVLLHI